MRWRQKREEGLLKYNKKKFMAGRRRPRWGEMYECSWTRQRKKNQLNSKSELKTVWYAVFMIVEERKMLTEHRHLHELHFFVVGQFNWHFETPPSLDEKPSRVTKTTIDILYIIGVYIAAWLLIYHAVNNITFKLWRDPECQPPRHFRCHITQW